MALCVDLESLPRCASGYVVLVQVVKSFTTSFDYYPGEKILLVVDGKGFRMPATIRSNEIEQFADTLQEGKWYYIHNVEVDYKPMKQRFSVSPYHLFLNQATIVQPFPGKKRSKLYDFKEIPKIENIFKEDVSVVDVIGAIFEVYRTTYSPATVRPFDMIPEERSIFFVLKDFKGRVISCVVKNEFHDRFLQAWLTTKPLCATVCVLHLWDIKRFEDGVALFANNKYSSISFEPEIEELYQAKTDLHFSDKFVDMYDDYWQHADRPSRGLIPELLR